MSKRAAGTTALGQPVFTTENIGHCCSWLHNQRTHETVEWDYRIRHGLLLGVYLKVNIFEQPWENKNYKEPDNILTNNKYQFFSSAQELHYYTNTSGMHINNGLFLYTCNK